MTVPSPKSVEDDRRPEWEKEWRYSQSLDAVKLKQLDIGSDLIGSGQIRSDRFNNVIDRESFFNKMKKKTNKNTNFLVLCFRSGSVVAGKKKIADDFGSDRIGSGQIETDQITSEMQSKEREEEEEEPCGLSWDLDPLLHKEENAEDFESD